MKECRWTNERFFDFPVIVRLEIDQRKQDRLILISVNVPPLQILELLHRRELVYIVDSGIGVALPQLLQFCDLMQIDDSTADLLFGRWDPDHPRDHTLVILDQRLPIVDAALREFREREAGTRITFHHTAVSNG